MINKEREQEAVRRKTQDLQEKMAILQAQLDSLQQESPKKQQKQKKTYKQPIIIHSALEANEESWHYSEASSGNESWHEEALPERRPDGTHKSKQFHKTKSSTPPSSELEEADWPKKFRLPAAMLDYDGESDPREFTLRYSVAISSAGGDDTTKAKVMVMALKGAAQQWYFSLPRGSITSWDQLHDRLENNFQGFQPQDLTSGDLHHIKQGDRESLQDYMKRFVKAIAKAPHVEAATVIDAIIGGLKVGPCGEYLDRKRPKTEKQLFDILNEYYLSDRRRKRRINEYNQRKKTEKSPAD